MKNNNYLQLGYRPILETNRSFGKSIFVGLITFGIYFFVQICKIAEETNIVCTRYDHKHTMNGYLVYLLLGPITFGIFPLIWKSSLYSRIGAELRRRQIDYEFGASVFWLYQVVGGIFVIPRLVGYNKLIEANRALNQSYNCIT